MDNEIEQLIGTDFRQFLGKFDSPKYPPWMKRKAEGMFQSVAHPDFNRDLGMLFYCDPKSIEKNSDILMHYFSLQYGVAVEIAETWIQLLITRSGHLFDNAYQISPTLLFDDDMKMAWPSDDPKTQYKQMQIQSKLDERNGYIVNLRIGRSSTKQDVKWLLDELWEKDIEPRLNKAGSLNIRQKPEYLRDSTAYSLYKNGKSMKEIANIIDDKFPLSPDLKNPDAVRVIDVVYIRKIISRFKPEYGDWFAEAIPQFMARPVDDLNSQRVKLTYSETPEPHFSFL